MLFHVFRNVNSNVILGKSWLDRFGVRLYFDLQCLRIGQTYAPFEPDVHIYSLLRMANSVTISPQTAHICDTKLKSSSKLLSHDGELEIIQAENGILSSQPGVIIANTIVKNDNNQFPILIVNNTQAHLYLRKGSVVAKASKIDDGEICAINRTFDLRDNKLKNEKQIDQSSDVQIDAKQTDVLSDLYVTKEYKDTRGDWKVLQLAL